MKTLTILLATVLALTAGGCEGDRGPVGPAGDDGNANVVTGAITPTNADWLWNSYFWYMTTEGTAIGYFTRYVDIPVAEITPDILANGVVLVSFQARPGQEMWTPLPFHFPSASHAYLHTIVCEVSEGLIRLHYFNIPNQTGVTLPDLETWNLPAYTFKYTVIAGTAMEELTAAGIDSSDREQVMEFLAAD